ncbi:hypothetical protein Y1Q_0015474 [Alligator mississippiensis]|uniref:Uncharacterized protein n=1 Tax=Alligator mississippiensis TaxID=8496 RepID=A0A151NDH7_ALLMI|nr:hypothetical protein Y1Q_0015474 [Alligator mississippiensis]
MSCSMELVLYKCGFNAGSVCLNQIVGVHSFVLSVDMEDFPKTFLKGIEHCKSFSPTSLDSFCSSFSKWLRK